MTGQPCTFTRAPSVPWAKRSSRPLLALLTLLTWAFTAIAAAADPAPWRSVYAGPLGTEEVIVDLTFLSDGVAHARVLLSGQGTVLNGSGKVADQDRIDVELRQHDPDSSPSLSLLYLTNVPGSSPTGSVEGHLSGSLDPTWEDDGRQLELVLTLGSVELAGTLPRVAQYSYLRLQEGRIDAGSAWPRFTAAPLRRVASSLEASAYDQVSTFVAEGRHGADDDSLGWGWTSDDYVDLMGAAGPYLSLLLSNANYTGGAHPNTYYNSKLYGVTPGTSGGFDLEEIALDDLFRRGSEWQRLVTDRVTADLLRQQATWIEQGTEVTVADLVTFVLAPDGLTFVFDPYAMGPYVQGAFTVIVPYGDLAGVAAPDGPLRAFLERTPPSLFR